MLNRFGGVGCAAGRIPLAAGAAGDCAAYLRKHVCRRECTAAAGEKIGIYDLFSRLIALCREKIGQIPLFFVFLCFGGDK